MNAHTPGPWFQSGDHDNQIRANSGDGETTICQVWSYDDSPLIAAAPELLDALKPLANFHIEDCPKCAGNGLNHDGDGACPCCGGIGEIVNNHVNPQDIRAAIAAIAKVTGGQS